MPPAMLTSHAPCPCGRMATPPAAAGNAAKRSPPRAAPLRYAECCGRYIDQAVPAPDAESLMRSRYTGFVAECADYLRATWHPSTRPATLEFDPGTKWLGLEVRTHRTTGQDRAEVEFVARYRVGGRAVRLHETSRFVREGGHWFYVDGDIHN